MGALTNRYEDDDASHLPPGMKRVGYDADTERYTFREGDDLWLGEPGSFYGGRMKWAGKMPQADGDDGKEDDIDGSSAGYSDHINISVMSLREYAREATEGGKDGNDGKEDDIDGSSAGHSDHSNTSVMSLREYAREATEGGKESPQNVADNLWGVPVVSISATGAKPPDSPKDKSAQRYPRKVRRAATLTANALGIINLRPGKDANTA